MAHDAGLLFGGDIHLDSELALDEPRSPHLSAGATILFQEPDETHFTSAAGPTLPQVQALSGTSWHSTCNLDFNFLLFVTDIIEAKETDGKARFTFNKHLYGANTKLKSKRHKLVVMIQGVESREPRMKQTTYGLSTTLQPALHHSGLP